MRRRQTAASRLHRIDQALAVLDELRRAMRWRKARLVRAKREAEREMREARR